MSLTLPKVQDLAARKDLVVSDHGYDELAADAIMVDEVLAGLPLARVVEDYPDFPKGPCVLVLQQDENGSPINVVWGIPMGRSSPAVLVTAYDPIRSAGVRISLGGGTNEQADDEARSRGRVSR